jgi:hypothetical protein
MRRPPLTVFAWPAVPAFHFLCNIGLISRANPIKSPGTVVVNSFRGKIMASTKKGGRTMASRTIMLLLALLLTGSLACADNSIKEGGKEVGQGVKKMGKATGKAVVKTGKATGKAFKDAGKATGEAFKGK